MKMDALIHHLDANRPLILGRALMSGAASLVPVPYIDELLAAMVRESLIRRLAEIRSVDIDPHAVQAVAAPHGSRLLTAATLGSAALGATRRAFRRIAASLLIVRRVDEAMQTFQVGTLFDHYCARHHVGLGLDAARAAKLRKAMDVAIRQTHGDAVQKGFRASLRAPVELPARVWARLRRKRGPIDAEKLDGDLRKAESSTFVQRAVGGVTGVGRGYGRALAAAFDEAFQE
jgi:uncharacterized protein (DUF697 family)